MTVVIINAGGDEIEGIREWRKNRREEWGGPSRAWGLSDYQLDRRRQAPCQVISVLRRLANSNSLS